MPLYYALPYLFSIILLTLGSSFFTTFISIKMNNEGASQFIIGCVHSAFYLGMLLGAMLTENIIIKMRYIYSYILFSSIISITILLQYFVHTPVFWVIMRFIFGICMAGIYIISESCLLSGYPSQNRGKILSFYMMIIYATQAISHELLKFIEIGTLMPFVCAALLCGLSPMPLTMIKTLFFYNRVESQDFTILFKSFPFGVICCLISGLILSAIFSFVPNFIIFLFLH